MKENYLKLSDSTLAPDTTLRCCRKSVIARGSRITVVTLPDVKKENRLIRYMTSFLMTSCYSLMSPMYQCLRFERCGPVIAVARAHWLTTDFGYRVHWTTDHLHLRNGKASHEAPSLYLLPQMIMNSSNPAVRSSSR